MLVLSEHYHCHCWWQWLPPLGPLAAPLGSSAWSELKPQQLKPLCALLEAVGCLPQPFILSGALLAPLPRIPESPALSSKAPLLIRAGGKESSGVCSEQELIKIQKVISLLCPLITGNPGRPDQTQTCRLCPRVMWYKGSCLRGGVF